MTSLLWIVIFCSASLILALILVFLSKKYIGERSTKSPQDDRISEFFDTIGRFFKKDKKKKGSSNLTEMEKLKQKMQQEILIKSSKMAQKAREIYSSTPMEERKIEQGGKLFSQFSIDLNSAIPRNEVELKQDMSDLMEAVKTLEDFDREQYVKGEEEGLDVGKSMFYDRITSKLYKIMRKENLTKERFLVFDKLVYLALKNLKNINHKDLDISLRYMKEAGYIRNFIEINTQLTIVTQEDQDLSFTNPEKVVLVFAYENDDLTVTKLIEDSKWEESYAKKIINNLVDKGIAEFDGEKIKIIGFETPEERRLRIELENQVSLKMSEKKKKKSKQHKIDEVLEEVNELDGLNLVEEEIQIPKRDLETELNIEEDSIASERFKDIRLPEVKALPPSLKNVKLVEKDIIRVKDPLNGENKGEISKETGHTSPKESNLDDILEEDFENLIGSEFVGDDDEELELNEDAIIDGIISIFEKFEHMNGGLMDLDLIHQLLLELYPNVTLEEIESTIPTLKNLGLVTKKIEIDALVILLFNKKNIDSEMLEMLNSISINGWMTKDELSDKLHWDEEKTLNTMKKLQDIEVLRLDPENRVVIPGLLTNKKQN